MRLRLCRERGHTRHTSLIPSGSRMPVVTFDGPFSLVYVFELNPLTARHAHTRLLDDSDLDSKATATVIVEDIEAALPGIVDPECTAIPYAVYRFGLPHLPPLEHAIRAVRMSTTGFTVTFEGARFDQTEQT